MSVLDCAGSGTTAGVIAGIDWVTANHVKPAVATPHVVGVISPYLQSNPGASPAAVEAAIEGNAIVGKVTSPGSGSPNLLLFTAY